MAEKQGTILSGVSGFPGNAANRLADYWITTAEELIAVAQSDAGEANLATVLDIEEEGVAPLVNLAVNALPAGAAFDASVTMSVGLGALPVTGAAAADAEPVSFASLPESVDYHDQLPEVRRQGGRSTCVAHAWVAVREYLIREENREGDFSEQFLYWACKERDNYNGKGTWVHTGMTCLQEQGVCLESVWPYNPKTIPGNEGQGPPPSEAATEAGPYRVLSARLLEPRWKDTLREYLAEGQIIAFSVPVYDYWFTAPTIATGDIRMPLPGEQEAGGHAMCMVGYVDDLDVPGGGYFLIRNSWGTDWAEESEIAPGYARLPYAYMQEYGWEAATASMN